ncbi:MAG: helix-turn-helix transcriptional regulator [Ruminococcaceae bacterium]|nr:helix-turn-helix transcriptional regulator [Oscillospiraceae bacterium]
MDIKCIDIEYVSKDCMNSLLMDKIRHIKALPYLSVVQSVEGSYDIRLGDGKTYSTGKRGFFIAPSNIRQTITHNADRSSGRMVCRWVFIKIRLDNLYIMDDIYDLPVILPENYSREMDTAFEKLFSAENIFEEYACYYEIVRILSSVALKKKDKVPSYIDAALSYIKGNYEKKITVGDIAQSVNLSESHFFSVFKKQTGVSPMAYLNGYRLSLAAELMIKTSKTISEISDLTGIRDSVYFNKLFRKAYQMSPSEYRKIFKA